MTSEKRSIILVFIGFFLNGFFVLSIGALMPDFIKNLDLSFTVAGSVLSMFAFGNLLSNFISPFLASKLGKRLSISLTSSMIPLGFLLVVVLGDKLRNFLPTLLLFMGIGRGSISIMGNVVINDLSTNKTKSINLLHTIWALGAFLSAFVILLLKKIGFSFNGVMLFLVFMTGLMWFIYTIVDYNYALVDENNTLEDVPQTSKKIDKYFATIALFMFFYLGLENTVNGWLMTYLQNTGSISESLASSIVSFTWLMIMFGRIFTAMISDRVNGNEIIFRYVLGISVMVVSLLFVNNQWAIFVTMLALGFFLSGVYPTSISSVSAYVKGNQKTMALLLTSAAIGGMITPQLIGIVADKTNILFAMNLIVVNIVFMIFFAFRAKKLYKAYQ